MLRWEPLPCQAHGCCNGQRQSPSAPRPQSSTGVGCAWQWSHTCAREGDSREASRRPLKLDHMHLNPSGAIVASVSPYVKGSITRTPTSWDPFADETRWFLHRDLGFQEGNLKWAKERKHKASHSMACPSWKKRKEKKKKKRLMWLRQSKVGKKKKKVCPFLLLKGPDLLIDLPKK